MGGARHAVDLAQNHRAPRHLCLVDRGQGTGPVADGGGALGRGPDDEPGLVDQMHDRQVEGVGQVDEPGHLLGRVRGPARAVVVGIAGEHRNRPARQAREPGDGRTPELAPELEERVAVDDRIDDRPHLVALASIAGDGVDEPLVASVGIVVALGAWGQRVHRRR